jgi:hypothetical protein
MGFNSRLKGLTAICLSPRGSTHLHTNNTQNNTNNNIRTTQIQTNVVECGPCLVFASFTLALVLQLRKKQGKTSVRVRKISVTVQYTYYQKLPHIIINFLLRLLTNIYHNTLANETKSAAKKNGSCYISDILSRKYVKSYNFLAIFISGTDQTFA